MCKRVFIGGAWPYANYKLHIGHLAALLPGDVIARYFRQKGAQVLYVSGSDCFGTPITETARKEGAKPIDIATRFHNEDVLDFQDLDFSYDNYGATFCDWHQREVQECFRIINGNGHLYRKQSSQPFCINEGRFLSGREIGGICAKCGSTARGDQCDSCLALLSTEDLKEKHCLICGMKITMRPSHDLVFSLSTLQDRINKYFEENSSNWRANAINETKKFIEQGLLDRDVTRNIEWGIDVPFDGYEGKKIYVWLEAVLGYMTSGRQAAIKLGMDFEDFLKNDDELRTYYVHGKDNIPFHTIILPALIMALEKDIQLPKYIVSSEYVNMGTEKMSKSMGNLITIRDLLSQYESDTIRFYFMMNNPEKKDISFDHASLLHVHNKVLVGGFGNFVNRNLLFLIKSFEGVIPKGKLNDNITKITENAYVSIGNSIETGNFRMAVDKMIEYIQTANKYYDEQQPWLQVKNDMDSFADTTATCLYIMANMSNLFAPILTKGCLKLRKMLNLLDEACWTPIDIADDLKLVDCSVLYNKIAT